MKRLALSIVVLLLLPIAARADERTIREEINAKVTQIAAMMGDSFSQEYKTYRGIQTLRNDKEDLLAAVAVFTIEGLAGGNNYTQFMAAFASLSIEAEGHPRRMSLLDVMAIGGKGLRGVEFKKIRMVQSKQDIIVTVPTEEYGPNDAMCCPSIKSEAQFIFQPYPGGRLKEITKREKN